jgi:O-antigen/teichoic acid export membrane protein
MSFSLSAVYQSKTVRTIAVFASGNTIAMLLGVVGSLVQARYVGPEDMGIFRTFGIFAGYLTFLHLGVFDGLQREIPLQLGRGNQAKAERSASACLAWITFISLLCGIIFLGLALRAAYYQEWMQFWGWLVYTLYPLGTFYGGYLGTTFRTGQQFITLSKVSVIQAIAGTLVLPLFPIMGYYGMCLRSAVTTVVNVFYLHRWRPMKVRPRLDWPSFREIVSIGLPLSSVGYIYTSLWVCLEGTFMLEWFGTEVLGLYSMAVFVRTLISQLAQNMNQVMNVKIYEQYGRSGRVKDCIRLIYKPMALAVLASFPVIVVGWFALPWVVSQLIPKYVDAVSMMRVMLLIMPLTFLNLPITILWAKGRRFDFFISVISGFSVFVGFSCVLFLSQPNIGALCVPIASILGQAIVALTAYVLIFRLVRHETRGSST